MSWPITAAAVVARARRNVGLGESPAGSNHNRITAAYGLVGPWCAMAVWDAFRPAVDLRKAMTGGWAATTAGANAAKAKGYWHPGTSGVRKGDVVFFKVPGGDAGYVNHVGIYDADGFTIDGNWANICQRIKHPSGWIVGYMRPPYAAPPKPTAPKPKPTAPKPKPTAPKPKPKPTKAPAEFPGADHFRLGHSDPAVTALDRQLIRTGYTRHNDGNGYQPGPVFTAYTRENVRDFQRAQGWIEEDADGYPGPETWQRLLKAATKTAG